MMYLELYVIQ